MNLAAYMQAHSLDDAAMAAKIKNCSPSAVKKWRYGERVPRPEQMLRIVEATDGKVTPNDFLPSGALTEIEAEVEPLPAVDTPPNRPRHTPKPVAEAGSAETGVEEIELGDAA